MAFRTLVQGDPVKVRKGEYFGQFGVVIDIQNNAIQVELQFHGEHWFTQEELLIADPSAYVYSVRGIQEEPEEPAEDDPYEEFADWDREDLINSILNLRKRVEALKNGY